MSQTRASLTNRGSNLLSAMNPMSNVQTGGGETQPLMQPAPTSGSITTPVGVLSSVKSKIILITLSLLAAGAIVALVVVAARHSDDNNNTAVSPSPNSTVAPTTMPPATTTVAPTTMAPITTTSTVAPTTTTWAPNVTTAAPSTSVPTPAPSNSSIPCSFYTPFVDWVNYGLNGTGVSCQSFGVNQTCTSDAECWSVSPLCVPGNVKALSCVNNACQLLMTTTPTLTAPAAGGTCDLSSSRPVCALCTGSGCTSGVALCVSHSTCNNAQQYQCFPSGHSA